MSIAGAGLYEVQSRKHSWIEAIANTLIGYLIAICSQLVVFPLLGIPVSFHQNLVIGLIFMGISLVRNYVLRRIFNWIAARTAA